MTSPVYTARIQDSADDVSSVYSKLGYRIQMMTSPVYTARIQDSADDVSSV